MIKKSLISALAILAGAAFADAAEMTYSYAGSNTLYQWGAKLAQSYDVAVKLPATGFSGCKIASVSVPVVSTENIADYSIWLSSELTLGEVDGKKVNIPDIFSASVEPRDVVESQGFIEYTFAEPVEISSDIYVGYSFNVKKIATDFERYPVLVDGVAQPDGFFVHSSKTYRQWQDRSEEIGCVSHLRIVLEGDFKPEAVAVEPLGDFPAQAGEVNKRSVTIHNLGSSPVASIDYEFTVDGLPSQGVYEFDQPVEAVYNRKAKAVVEVPAMAEGAHEYTFRITKVNGRDNGVTAECQGAINAFDVLPVKRPLMEEFTGTWCGWCPRGWVAMEMMNALYTDFVCISYHDSDALQLSSGYPAMVSGFPGSVLDRSLNVDPYYGSPEREFGIQQNWLTLSQAYTPAALTLQAVYDANAKTVEVTSDVFWAEAPEAATYKVEYVLVGDGIRSEALKQHNYYASSNPSSYGPELAQFCAGGEYGQSEVVLTFNDVALATSGLRGVDGSIVSTEAGTHNSYTHTFDLSAIPFLPLCSNIRVVAMILGPGGTYGKVLNSNKCAVEGFSGISDIRGDAASVESVRYFDISGRELSSPRGLCIKQVTFSDGSVSTSKLKL